MKKSLIFVLMFLFLPQTTTGQDIRAALNEMAKNYDECLSRLAERDTVIAMMQARKATADSLIVGYEANELDYDSLIVTHGDLSKKYEEQIMLSDSIAVLLKSSLNLSQISVKEVSKGLTDVNKKYNDCVIDCTRKWYERWHFYAGLVAGGLIGFVAGS